MKKFSTIIIAIALLFVMSQCKKNVETITPSSLGEAVHITLNVGDSGKHIVYPGTGAYIFENGDKIYVGNNGHYIGSLTYGSGVFSGTIYYPSTSDYLHFYFLGGKAPITAPSIGTTTSFTISITDQSDNLPVLSYGQSTQKYTDANTTYSTVLRNKCGLVKFSLTGEGTSSAVTISNLLNKATIDFGVTTPGITPTATTGSITLYSESEIAKWAILLPGSDLGAATTSGTISFEGDVPSVTNNGYINSGITITLPTPPIDAVYSVSDTKTVHFSPGNLQYKSGKGWRFALHQYDYVGEWNTSDWVDLFGWGTWGEGKNPLLTSYNATDYQWNTDFQGTLGGHSDWRTLTNEEWVYVFNNSARGSNRYLKANITVGSDSYNGVILFPDNYDGSIGSYTYNNINGWTLVSASDWIAMETAGAVFLPAAGYRSGTDVNFVEFSAPYWSKTPENNYDNARAAGFADSDLLPDYSEFRFYGSSVRLVR
jgi:hypothetical protein